MKTPNSPPTLSEKALLTPRIWKEGSPYSPTTNLSPLIWSPNGRSAAYVLEERQQNPKDWERTSLCCIRADGREARRLYSMGTPQMGTMGKDVFYETGGQIKPDATCWSPDSQRILFWMCYPHGGSVNADGSPLYDIPITGGKPRCLTPERVKDDELGGMMRRQEWLTFSPDGSQLLLVAGYGRWSVYNKRLSCLAYPSGKRLWVSERGWAVNDPVWSPDGREIACVMTRDPGTMGGFVERRTQMRLFVMDANGRGKRRLTNDSRYRESEPQWVTVVTNGRPSQVIHFIRDANADTTEKVPWGSLRSLWEIRPDGSGLRKLRPLPPLTEPDRQ